MQDFPAAHSMDTDWFAVDADGNIGLFDSGEGGAVPESNDMLQKDARTKGISYMDNVHALFWEWSRESSDSLVRVTLTSQDVLRGLGIDIKNLDLGITNNAQNTSYKILPSSISTPWDESEISSPRSGKSWEAANTNWLLLPSGKEDKLIELVKHHALRYRDYIVLFSGEPTLIFLPHCPLTTIQMLFRKNHLRYALALKPYRIGLATLLGLFYYQHNYCGPCPYDCDGQPIYSLKFSELPEKLQDVVTWNWFENIKFSESRTIQPIEHTRCRTWRSHKWWWDTEGNEREGHPHDRD